MNANPAGAVTPHNGLDGLADVRGALANQGVREDSLEPGDAILFNDGLAVYWNNSAV